MIGERNGRSHENRHENRHEIRLKKMLEICQLMWYTLYNLSTNYKAGSKGNLGSESPFFCCKKV